MDKYAIFHIDGGCGKNIVATSVVKSIKAAYPEHKLIVVTAYPEVFVHNPHIYRVYKFGNIPYFYDDYIDGKDSVILRSEPYHSGDLLYRKKSLTEIWCDIFNIPCIDKKPEIYLTERELIFAQKQLQKEGPILLVQSSGGAEQQGHPYSWSRDLPPSFAQEVVNSVKNDFSKVLHIRRENQPAIEGTVHISDNFRNLFCYVALSDKILGIDSFAQHAAAAFGKKATVGWISNSPVVFGHEIHNNIIASGAESFRHRIDSYLEEDDWTGGRFHECPYDNLANLFNKDQFVKSILSSDVEYAKFGTKENLIPLIDFETKQPEIIFS
jgi:hypothetical protein